MKKVNSWDNTVLYQYTHKDNKTYNVEIETIKDKKGSLKRVQCSLTGFFECYGMNEVKNKLNNFNN